MMVKLYKTMMVKRTDSPHLRQLGMEPPTLVERHDLIYYVSFHHVELPKATGSCSHEVGSLQLSQMAI